MRWVERPCHQRGISQEEQKSLRIGGVRFTVHQLYPIWSIDRAGVQRDRSGPTIGEIQEVTAVWQKERISMTRFSCGGIEDRHWRRGATVGVHSVTGRSEEHTSELQSLRQL